MFARFIGCFATNYSSRFRGGMCYSIHAQRPVPCRAYDCRQDQRIWSDFAQRIVSPELDKLFESSQWRDDSQ